MRTYDVDAMITRGSNTYGPYQYPEKMIPLFTTNLLDGQPVPVYGDGRQARDFIWVEDHCAGIELVLEKGERGRGLQRRRRPRDREPRDDAPAARADRSRRVVRHARQPTGSGTTAATRSTAASCVRSAGRRETSFAEGLERTVSWYGERRDWWEPIKRGEVFESYSARQYGSRA